MSTTAAALCYLLMFRLAMIGAGSLCTFLGYRLFVHATRIGSVPKSGATVESNFGIARLTLKGAAPGTCFAFFGALLLIVTMVEGRPSVTLHTLLAAGGGVAGEQPNGMVRDERVDLRSAPMDSFGRLTAEGIDFDRRGDSARAQRSYELALEQMAEPINNLAWLYLRASRAKDAAGLAMLAVELRPDEPRYVDTLEKARIALK